MIEENLSGNGQYFEDYENNTIQGVMKDGKLYPIPIEWIDVSREGNTLIFTVIKEYEDKITTLDTNN